MSSIQGYASATSVFPGEHIDFMVSYDHEDFPADFTINIFREGATSVNLNLQLKGQADVHAIPEDFNYNGCRWPAACHLIIPDSWTSGVYRAHLVGHSGDATDIIFVVKAAVWGTTSKILLALTVSTYQAYNGWGGSSLYSSPRSVTVSFNRPGDHIGFIKTNGELSFIRWVENNHISVEFCTSIDLHADPTMLNYYQLLLSIGHDEYWSKEMRDVVEAFVTNGGNVAFFSGNVCWWQVRFENNYCRMVCYKSDEHNVPPDDTPDPALQTDPSRATIHWHSAPVSRPENQMTGVSFRNGAGWWDSWPTGQPYPDFVVRNSWHWVFDGTGLQDSNGFGSAAQIIWDETDAAEFTEQNGVLHVTGNDGTPLSFIILATADLRNWKDQSGWATMGIYRNNGGTVFTAATIGWSRGLEANDSIVSQITTNVLLRLCTAGITNGQVFAGGGGTIYAIDAKGDLYWYKDLAENGTEDWAFQGTGQKIGSGWNFRQVFSGGGGVIYAIDLNGDLYWYKDLAQDGNENWAFQGTGQKIGSGWNFRQVFSAEGGIIYAITANGDIYWYKDLARDGTENWANEGIGQKIGNGWNFRQVFSGGGGVIYAIDLNGDLYWYKDLLQNGTLNWANYGSGKKIDSKWTF